jgi:Tfp pilus assembly PilM family ATPase
LARYLALDWAANRLHLVAVNTARGKLRVEQAAQWDETEALTPATAEAQGQRLREHLKDKGIAPAPVLVGLGRDNVILKEVRYPKTTPAEEPAIIRFQVAKELTEAPESVVIDYTRLDRPGPNGERRALVVIVRKELLNNYKALCKAAGLKLVAATPRAFGTAECLRHAGASAAEATAVVAVAERWAEFEVVRGETLLFARSLTPGAADFLGEVRRNLSLYAHQPQVEPVQALYVAGDPAQAAVGERLAEIFAIPVKVFDPLPDVPAAEGDRVGYTAAVGLAQLWVRWHAAPVNFVAPKEPKPEIETGRRKLVRVAGLAVVALLAFALLSNLLLSARSAERDRLKEELQQIEEQNRALAPALAVVAQLKDYHASQLSVRDEFFDLASRFPGAEGFRLNSARFALKPATQNQQNSKEPKDPHTVQMTLVGVVPSEKVYLVQALVDAINHDAYCRAPAAVITPKTGGKDKGKDLREFAIHVDIEPRPAPKYDAQDPRRGPAQGGRDRKDGKGGDKKRGPR